MLKKERSLSASTATATAEMRESEQVVFLRGANERLTAELRRARLSKQEMVEAVYRAARDAASGLVIPSVRAPVPRRGKGDEEKAIALLGDTQLGKRTPTYDSATAERRVMEYADKIISLTDIQRMDHPIKECRVYMLGDMIEGELIFPHQPWQVDSSLFKQVTIDGPRILIKFLRRLLTAFDLVHAVCVIGNHGRLGPKRSPYNPETNMDRMLYQITKDRMENEKRLTWHIPYEKNERAWYAVDRPFEKGPHGFLLFHGDQIPGSASHSVATIAKRVYGWAAGSVPEPFDHVVYGHWHNARRFRFNKFRVWCNGSTESSNTFAQEVLGEGAGPPTQLLLFTHPTHGVSAEYEVELA